MEPTQKSAGMEATIKDLFGFDRRKVIQGNKCAPKPFGCGKAITGFKDPLSEKEYRISGLCQECQDSVFTEPEE